MKPRQVRVAYLCHEYPKLTETFVYREIDRLRKLGMDVAVLAMKRPARSEAIDDFDRKVQSAKYLAGDFSPRFLLAQLVAFLRAPLLYLSLLINILKVDAEQAAASAGVRLGFFLRGALAACELRRMPGIRLLHCPFTGDEIIAAHVASVLTGIPLSFTLHAPLPLYRRSPLLAMQARHAALIASISEDARNRIIDIAGPLISDRVEIVRCGVDIPQDKPGADTTDRRIISVGSLSQYKGHDVLVRALGILAQKGVSFSCDIVGEGPERPRLEKLIGELGLTDRVKLHGGRSQEVVGEMLNAARLFALASRVDDKGARDGVPVAIMEAMARARPCVSTRVSGIPELVKDGETGFLVEPENPEALADAMQKLIEKPDLARSMGEKGLQRVKKAYSLEEGSKKLLKEFKRLSNTLAYLSHEYPKVTETFVKREVEALRRAGMRVIVYSFQRPAGEKDAGTIYLPGSGSPGLYLKSLSYMVCHPFKSLRLLSAAVRSVGSPGTWRAGWGGVVDVFRGAWLAGRSGPEVTAFHGSFASVTATAAWAAGTLAGVPFGFTSHSSPPDPLLGVKCLDASWIFSESEFDRNYISSFAGQSVNDKISIVRCGLDPGNWPEPDWNADRYEKGPALFVGTLGPKKGVIPLMEAVISLGQKNPDFRLEVVGDGPLMEDMRSRLRAGGAEEMVKFLGELTFDELRDAYMRARFLVLPAMVTPQGDRDGIPVTLMEAMASGLACVTAPVSGIPELVEDSVTGFIVPSGESEAAASAMARLWNDADLCRKMGKSGRERVFNLHRLDEQVRGIISGLVKAGALYGDAMEFLS